MPGSTRREIAAAAGAAVLLLAARSRAEEADAGRRFAAIEAESGGRLGVAALDTGSGRRAGYREGERFPLGSTFKLLAAGFVLARADRGEDGLDRRVVFGTGDLVTYSPVTGSRVGGDGMSLAELCHAAITTSDNTAGNLLLASFGGPAGLTAFLRRLGDGETRLDRIETALNEARPGDPRDTTSPAAFLSVLRPLLIGDALSAGSRRQLTEWLVQNTTGGARIRAGLPAGWRVGDKTGTSANGAVSDVGIAWPPDGAAPILLAVYTHESSRPVADLNRAVAAAARVACEAVRAP